MKQSLPLLPSKAFLLISILLLAGCQSTSSTRKALSASSILVPTTVISTANQKISTASTTIQKEAMDGAKSAPELPQWTIIDEQARLIDAQVILIDEQATKLSTISKDVDRLVEKSNEQEKFILKLKAEIKSGERQFLLWLYGIGVFVGIAGIVIALAWNVKLGAAITFGGAIMVTVAKILLNYAVYVYAGVGFILLIVVGFMAYKHFFVMKKMLPQVMETVNEISKYTDGEIKSSTVQQTQDTNVQRALQKLLHKDKLRSMT